MIGVEDPHRHVEDDQRMEKANAVLEQVVSPIVYGALGADIVQLWVQFPHLATF